MTRVRSSPPSSRGQPGPEPPRRQEPDERVASVRMTPPRDSPVLTLLMGAGAPRLCALDVAAHEQHGRDRDRDGAIARR